MKIISLRVTTALISNVVDQDSSQNKAERERQNDYFFMISFARLSHRDLAKKKNKINKINLKFTIQTVILVLDEEMKAHS